MKQEVDGIKKFREEVEAETFKDIKPADQHSDPDSNIENSENEMDKAMYLDDEEDEDESTFKTNERLFVSKTEDDPCVTNKVLLQISTMTNNLQQNTHKNVAEMNEIQETLSHIGRQCRNEGDFDIRASNIPEHRLKKDKGHKPYQAQQVLTEIDNDLDELEEILDRGLSKGKRD